MHFPNFIHDEDSSWSELRSRLTFQVRGWVYSSHVPCWLGQKDEITDDIVSESLKHLIERVIEAKAGTAEPIASLYPFARQVAYHCFIDQVRKDKKKVRFSQITTEYEEEAVIGLILADMEDTTLNTVDFEQFFKIMAREIATFPKKQKEAMLRDHARRAISMTNPAPLLHAYQSAGIQLMDYLNYTLTDEVEKRRYSSILHCAYRRLSLSIHLEDFEAIENINLKTDSFKNNLLIPSRPNQKEKRLEQMSMQNMPSEQPKLEQEKVSSLAKNTRSDMQRGANQESEIATYITQLPEPYRTAIQLHCLEKWSYTEIALQFGLQKGTVKSHISRGKKLLSNLMRQDEAKQKQEEITEIQSLYEEDRELSAFDIAQLPEPYRSAILLHCIEKYSYAKISTQLGLPEGTVKSHISRGKKLLNLRYTVRDDIAAAI